MKYGASRQGRLGWNERTTVKPDEYLPARRNITPEFDKTLLKNSKKQINHMQESLYFAEIQKLRISKTLSVTEVDKN